jgi:integrase
MSLPPRRLTQQFVESIAWNGKKSFIRDADLKGFVVVVNKTSKSYMVQRDVWKGERGNRCLVGTRRVLIGRTGAMSLKEARDKARDVIAQMARGEVPCTTNPKSGLTLKDGLRAYIDWLTRRNRSAATSKYYRYNIEKHLADWLDLSLATIGDDRKGVRERHLFLTEQRGPHTANATMRGLRAVYRHERRVNPSLPECPVDSRDFNGVTVRDRYVAVEDLPDWKTKVEGINNPIRRDLQLFLLFSGMRRTAACEARWEEFDQARRVLHVPRPKGGERKAFDLVLSDYLFTLLMQRREQNELLYPGSPWIFPSNSRSGRVSEPKISGLPSAHALRHSFATHARGAGINHADLKLLLNHSSGDVTQGYVHERGLLNHLRQQMEQASRYLLEHMNKPVEKTKNFAGEPSEEKKMETVGRIVHQQEVTP